MLEGYSIAKPGTLKSHSQFKAKFDLLEKDHSYFKNKFKDKEPPSYLTGHKFEFHFGVAKTDGTINLPSDKKEIHHGETVDVIVKLNKAIPLKEEDVFAIRENGLTLGQGKVIKINK